MSMSKHLPEELITTEILHRLPAKFVGRFRCVSKGWRSSLSSPQFVKSHLNFHTQNDPQNLVLTSETCNILAINSSSSGALKKVPSPLEKEGKFFGLGSSCHGLVVIRVGDGLVRFLMNPVTREALRVRNWPAGRPKGMVHGLGYDSSSDDYKIVNISWSLKGRSLDVYSVRKKSWRTIRNSADGFEHHVPSNGGNGVFVNGCIHWLGSHHINGRRRAVICAFNLSSEEFEVIQLPGAVESACKSLRTMKCQYLGGCLALVPSTSSSIDVWLLKEYGAWDSWAKLTINSPVRFLINQYNVISLLNTDEVVLISRAKVATYNCTSGVRTDVVVAGLSGWITEALPIEESLVSPYYY